MKKIISLTFVMFMTLTASAQYWQKSSSEGDELTGAKATSSIVTKIPGKGIISLDDNDNSFFIQTFEGIFNYERINRYGPGVIAIFGMYDEADKLISKEEIFLFVSSESPKYALGKDDAAKREKVASWIRNQKGSVRIVIPRYGDVAFDVKVPTVLSQKVPSSTNKPQTRSSSGTKRPVRRR